MISESVILLSNMCSDMACFSNEVSKRDLQSANQYESGDYVSDNTYDAKSSRAPIV